MDINEERSKLLKPQAQVLHNYAMERRSVKESSHTRKRRYKHIIQDLGEREIHLNELADGTKNSGVLDAVLSNGGTLDEFVILQQYAKAIVEADTRAAEFLRDTSGQKPTTSVDLATNTGGLQEMTLEELTAFREELENAKKDE